MITMTDKEMVLDFLRALSPKLGEDEWDIEDRLSCVHHPLAEQVSSHGGASKVCLIFKGFPYVVKWVPSSFYDEAMEEVEIYEKAVQARLGQFFPHTEFLVRFNDINFVLQSRIDSSASDLSFQKVQSYQRITKTVKKTLVKKMEDEINKASPDYNRTLNILWGSMVISLYGKRVAKALCEFIKENSINDLHGNNIGYFHNRPILLDFSGYHRKDY